MCCCFSFFPLSDPQKQFAVISSSPFAFFFASSRLKHHHQPTASTTWFPSSFFIFFSEARQHHFLPSCQRVPFHYYIGIPLLLLVGSFSSPFWFRALIFFPLGRKKSESPFSVLIELLCCFLLYGKNQFGRNGGKGGMNIKKLNKVQQRTTLIPYIAAVCW